MNTFRSLSLTAALLLAGFTAATASTKDSAAYYLEKGRSEELSNRPNSAWKFYEKATTFDPNNIAAQTALADVCIRLHKMAPAMKALENVARLNPSDRTIQARLLKFSADNGQWDKVIASGTTLYKADPKTPGLALTLGKAYYNKQNYAMAMPMMRQAEKLEPANAEVPYMLGRMYLQMSQYETAAGFYKKSLNMDSAAPAGRYYEYAMVLATAEDFKESIKMFQKALEKGYSARDDFHMNYANTLADANKTNEAIAMLKDMLQRRPEDVALTQTIAGVCYKAGKYREAINYWDSLLKMNKKDAQTLYHIGMCYIKMGKEEDGKALCDKAIEMEPALGQLRTERKLM